MNETKYEKFLPLGSVVLMKSAKKRVMITGYAVSSPESGNKIWDYIGCLWPEGMIASDKNLLFDHKDIEKVFAVGFIDDEQKMFIERLNNALKFRENKVQNESEKNVESNKQINSEASN